MQLQSLPIITETSDIISQFCISNAKSYFTINLQPKLSTSFLNNLCQGALSSSTFLEIKDGQYMS